MQNYTIQPESKLNYPGGILLIKLTQDGNFFPRKARVAPQSRKQARTTTHHVNKAIREAARRLEKSVSSITRWGRPGWGRRRGSCGREPGSPPSPASWYIEYRPNFRSQWIESAAIVRLLISAMAGPNGCLPPPVLYTEDTKVPRGINLSDDKGEDTVVRGGRRGDEAPKMVQKHRSRTVKAIDRSIPRSMANRLFWFSILSGHRTIGRLYKIRSIKRTNFRAWLVRAPQDVTQSLYMDKLNEIKWVSKLSTKIWYLKMLTKIVSYQ